MFKTSSMGHYLIKISDTEWYIKSGAAEAVKFETIEKACDFMVDYMEANDDEIDLAITEMARKGHNAAHFGIMNCSFIFSLDYNV